MKSIVISALALGAMTSVAFAEEPLTPTAGEPMQLSLAQLDDVTAGLRINANVSVVRFRIRQSNELEIEQETELEADDIKGNCDDCTVIVDASANASVEQSNDLEFEIEVDQEIDD